MGIYLHGIMLRHTDNSTFILHHVATCYMNNFKNLILVNRMWFGWSGLVNHGNDMNSWGLIPTFNTARCCRAFSEINGTFHLCVLKELHFNLIPTHHFQLLFNLWIT